MKRVTIGITIVLVILAIGGAAIFYPKSRWFREFEVDESSFDSEIIETVQQDSGIKLPKGVRGLRFIYKPPIDPSFLAVIEVPDSAMDDIISEIKSIQQSQQYSASKGSLEQRVSWWNPSDGNVIIERRTFHTGTKIHAVLTRQDGSLLLYVKYST